MTKKIILFLSIVLLCMNIHAQRKITSLGIRIEGNDPSNLGISLRHRIHSGTMLEGIVHFYDGAVGVSGLFEKYHNLSSSGAFDFYYGGGVHVAFYNNIGAGVVGIVGLCYTFKEIPFNISVDWKPVLDIVDNVDLRARLLGVSIRYTF